MSSEHGNEHGSAVAEYEALVASYNDRLLNQLRGHGVDLEFLEMWVPDEDAVSSIINMVEAAEAYGTADFSLYVGTSTLSGTELADLSARLGGLAGTEVTTEGGRHLVRFSDIGR